MPDPRSLLVGLLATAALVACESSSADGEPDSGATDSGATDAASMGGDPELVAFLRETYGLRMVQLDAQQDVVEGRIRFVERYRVELEGEPTGDIELEQTIFPMAEGGGITLALVDAQTNDVRSFGWTIADNAINLTRQDPGVDQAHIAHVYLERNGRYTLIRQLDGEAEQIETDLSGRRAVELLDDFIDFGSAPARVTMAAFAIAHTSPPEARTPVSCDDTASTPPVCDVFSAFCDCVPCRALDRPELCARCPED